MSKLRKPTEAIHRRIDQQLREILGPEEGGGLEGTWRQVLILVPPSPGVHFSIDAPTPDEAGPNRLYDVPRLYAGAYTPIDLQPDQCLYAGTDSEHAAITLVVHYREE